MRKGVSRWPSSLGQCGISSWHPQVTFKMQAWFLKQDLTGIDFQNECLSIQQQHLSMPKYSTEECSGPGEGHAQPYAKPSCLSPYTHGCTPMKYIQY